MAKSNKSMNTSGPTSDNNESAPFGGNPLPQGDEQNASDSGSDAPAVDSSSVEVEQPEVVVFDGTTYTLTLRDDFDNLNARTGHGSEGIWNTSFSPHQDDTRSIAANGESQYYVDPDMADMPNPFSIDDGILTISAAELTQQQSHDANGQEYSSGLLSTELSFGAAGGYFEMSASIPDQQGFLSSFWLLPVDGDWSAEIDLFEILGSSPDTLNTNYWVDGEGDELAIQTADLSDGFHTYGLLWTDTEISWMIDGQVVRTVDNTIDEPMYLAISLAVDTNWTGSVDETTDFSDGFQIDYVKVYENQDLPDSNAPITGDQLVAEITEYTNGDADGALYGTRWGDIIDGHDGVDVIYGKKGDDTLDGGAGKDKLYGQDGKDTLKGGADGDMLIGGAGEDTLIGGTGTDHIWGGSWGADFTADVFVYRAGDGTDYIHDFEAGLDQLDYSALGISWDDLLGLSTETNGSVHIDMEAATGVTGDQVYLLGVTLDSFSETDYTYA